MADEEAEQGDAFSPTGRTVNFDPEIYAAICAAGGLNQENPSSSEEGKGVVVTPGGGAR
ncbi:hypothetical protein [Parasphingorhabdus halotolerans]|uniref:Uncharacterized protein n=1 Tax=Parasphingorhabdus halotolerans TaxID=2725558 RepID=A0A6H2DQN2_9SPHN|nr:hypothetical protein [Parasphingorhabdus halotolerans]QJB70265.1 hypothetical protein HF685_14100 [Parasphingorhabdus halotolerans]